MSDLKQLTQVEFNNIVKSLQNYEKDSIKERELRYFLSK